MSTPFLTLFTAPKPFVDSHTRLIQENAFASWQALGAEVAVVVVGNEEGIAEATAKYGFIHQPNVKTNRLGTPLISSIFELGRNENESPFLAYVNADIILFPELIEQIKNVAQQAKEFLMIGQRWDLEVLEALNFSSDWVPGLKERMHRDGSLHLRTGSDYFIYPRACFKDMPDFTVGRAGWDNWMIYQARRQVWMALDCSADVEIIHQNHDYRHLPGGQAHYRLPETGENIRLAGGRRTIFLLDDASHRLVGGKIEKMPLTWKRFWRELENRPLLHGNYELTQKLFTLFHPEKAKNEKIRDAEMAVNMAQAELEAK